MQGNSAFVANIDSLLLHCLHRHWLRMGMHNFSPMQYFAVFGLVCLYHPCLSCTTFQLLQAWASSSFTFSYWQTLNLLDEMHAMTCTMVTTPLSFHITSEMYIFLLQRLILLFPLMNLTLYFYCIVTNAVYHWHNNTTPTWGRVPLVTFLHQKKILWIHTKCPALPKFYIISALDARIHHLKNHYWWELNVNKRNDT